MTKHEAAVMKLTQRILKDIITYDPVTGLFTWRERDLKYFKDNRADIQAAWNARFSNKQAGYYDKKGYLAIRVFDVLYLGHRLAWLYMKGRWPTDQIDHINHIPKDNRISNLRECNNKENHKNQSLYSSNTSGVAGVSFCSKSNKWAARIKTREKYKFLGYFEDKFEAICCVISARKRYGFHENHGV